MSKPTVRRMLAAATAGAVVSGILAVPQAHAAGDDTTVRVSLSSAGTPGMGGAAGAQLASVSQESGRVVFWSDHTNLVGSQTANHIYLRDGSTTSIVDVSTSGAVGNANGDTASISASGTKIAFSSLAGNLVAGDSTEFSKVFLRDTAAGTTTRLSAAVALNPDGNSWFPAISRDGTRVAFSSDATNLVAGDTNASTDVFVATTDTPTPTVTRVSVGGASTQSNGISGAPAISDNGRYVAFISEASNLVSGDTNNRSDVFVRDVTSSTTIRVSVKSDGTQGAIADSGVSSSIGISGDGRYVVFDSRADLSGLGSSLLGVYLHDRDADGNGEFDETAVGARSTKLISVTAATGAPLAAEASFPMISSDGSLISYRTADPAALPANAAANSTNNIVLVERYLTAALTPSFRASLLSVRTDESQPSDIALLPTDLERAANGVVRATWQSRADFVAGDTDGLSDVYLRTLLRPDAPIVTAPSDGALLATGAVTISGAAVKGSRVDLYRGSGPGATKVAEQLLPGVAANENFSFPLTLVDDVHTYSLVAVRAGASSDPTAVTFTVDTLTPGSTVTYPAPGGRYAGAWTGTLLGSASDPIPASGAGAQTKVEVVATSVRRLSDGQYLSGGTFSSASEVFTPTADAHPVSTWSTPLPLASLTDGSYTLRTRARDKAGNVESTIGSTTFTIDTTAPTVGLTAPVNTSTVGSRRPLVKGTAGIATGDLGDVTIKIYSGGTATGTALAVISAARNATTGSFEGAPSSDLADGLYTATATQADDLGNTSTSAPTSFTVDGSLPRVGITSPIESSGTADTTPVINGTASHSTGVTVELFAGTTTAGAPVRSATVTPAGGSWSVELTPALPDATYTVRAKQTNIVGEGTSVPVTFVVNTATPVVTITTPVHDSWVTTATPAVAGTASASTDVALDVFVGGSIAGSPVQTATRPVAGAAWSATLAALSEQTYTIRASQTVNPNTGTAASTIRVDLTDPVGAVTFPASGSGYNAASFAAGATTSCAVVGVCGTAVDARSGISAIGVALYNVDTNRYWNGATAFDALAPVYGAANATLPAAAGAETTWTLAFDPANFTVDAQYRIDVRTTDRAGRVSTVSRSFAFDNNLAAPQIIAPMTGASLNSSSVVVSGTAEPGASITVKDGSTEIAPPALIAAPITGAWQFTVTLAEGGHSLVARAQDIGGNISLSSPRVFTVDLTAPLAPVITAPTTNSFTSATTVSIVGTAEAGSTVQVYLNGAAVTTTIASGTGAFLATLSGLADRPYDVKVRAIDAATNVGPFSSTVRFTVDTLAPAAPLLSAPLDGSTVVGPIVGVTGSGEPFATIRLTEGATLVGTATVSPSGSWHANISLSLGAHTLSARQVDRAGNASVAGPVHAFTVVGTVLTTSILSPLEQQVLGSRDLVVSGRAVPGEGVQVWLEDGQGGAVAIGARVNANSAGSWAVPIRLGEGTHVIYAVATGGSISASRAFSVASGIPTFTSPAQGAIVPRPFPLTGTAKPGATVSVVFAGSVVRTATADNAGVWSMSLLLPEGTRTITAYAGAGQNRTEDAEPLTVVVDASGPAVNVRPSSSVLGTGGSEKMITGSATDTSAVASITVRYRNLMTGAVVVATGVTCTGCGSTSATFSHVPTVGTGYWSVEAIATDLVGNQSQAGSAFLMTI